jgi:hypothetical protein
MTYDQQKYNKAKQDFLKAAKSFNDLNPQQRQQLAEELIGTEIAIDMYNIMQQYFYKNFLK